MIGRRRDPDKAGGVRLAATYLRVGIMNELQYRINFVFQLISSLLEVGTGLLVLFIVFSYTNDLGGWSQPQLLAVMGIFTLMRGIVGTFIEPNMQRIVAEVREGKLDYALTKPADSQVLVSVRDVRFWQLTDTLVGVIVLIVAMVQLRDTLTVGDIALFIVMLTIGSVCIYCFWLMLATASFWLVRIDEVQELFTGLYRAGQYPTGIYPGWLRFGVTFIVPLTFAISVPAEAATGRIAVATIALSIAAMVVLITLSRWLWKRGLGRYDGASA